MCIDRGRLVPSHHTFPLVPNHALSVPTKWATRKGDDGTIATAFTISGALERQDIYLPFVRILNTYVFGESKKIHTHEKSWAQSAEEGTS